jgi:hypothetical protein
MRSRLWIFTAAALLASCARRPFQDPSNVDLPRINLTMLQRGGIELARISNEIRYELENELAENRIAVSGGPREEQAPEFWLDLIDRGIAPCAEPHLRDLSSIEPYLGPSPATGVDYARLLDGAVYMRRARETEEHFIGRVRGVVGGDPASAAKLAELIANVIRQGLSGPPPSDESGILVGP